MCPLYGSSPTSSPLPPTHSSFPRPLPHSFSLFSLPAWLFGSPSCSLRTHEPCNPPPIVRRLSSSSYARGGLSSSFLSPPYYYLRLAFIRAPSLLSSGNCVYLACFLPVHLLSGFRTVYAALPGSFRSRPLPGLPFSTSLLRHPFLVSPPSLSPSLLSRFPPARTASSLSPLLPVSSLLSLSLLDLSFSFSSASAPLYPRPVERGDVGQSAGRIDRALPTEFSWHAASSPMLLPSAGSRAALPPSFIPHRPAPTLPMQSTPRPFSPHLPLPLPSPGPNIIIFSSPKRQHLRFAFPLVKFFPGLRRASVCILPASSSLLMGLPYVFFPGSSSFLDLPQGQARI